jgi:hypothetical protein
VNLYGFARLRPHELTDPLGLVTGWDPRVGPADVFPKVDIESGNKLLDYTMLGVLNTALDLVGGAGNAALSALYYTGKAIEYPLRKAGWSETDIEALNVYLAMNPAEAAMAMRSLQASTSQGLAKLSELLQRARQSRTTTPAPVLRSVGAAANVELQAAPEVSYTVDETGLTTRAEGTITGPHPGRGKGYRPAPSGGVSPGEHRGHLIPEGGVDNPSLVNVQENIISETPRSNLSLKKKFDNLASRFAAQNPGSVIRVVAEPLRRAGETRPYAVTYWIEQDGARVFGQTIFNK